MTKEQLLRDTELFLLDLDGTVYLGDRLIGEMDKTLARLREMGKKLVFLTNNSSRTREEYVARLQKMGLFCAGDDVYTSAMATAEYLCAHFAEKPAFLVATEAVKEEFLAAGVKEVKEKETPGICVLAYDTELTFLKLQQLDYYLQKDVPLIATHPDDVCPTSYGSKPDVGSFLALLERSSGRKPLRIIGKPSPLMGECLSERTGIPVRKMCMVGDRLHTDIRFANACNMHSVLVFSGETTRETMQKYPDRAELDLPDLNAIFCGD